jgi:elongation factor 1-gamma
MFGAHSVYGANYNCLTRGVYLVRGQDFKPAFEAAPDWESYDFTKLDPANDRKEIEDLLAWDTSVFIDGKEYPWVDGHILK